MRILFHKWEYPPQGSGIGRYIYILARALRAAGHFVVIVTSRYPGSIEKEEIPNGIIYRLFDEEKFGSKKVCDKVLEIAKLDEIDIIEGADHLGESLHLLSMEERPPVCIKLHYNDVISNLRYAQVHYPWQYFSVWLACLRQRQRIKAEKYSMEQADLISAPSKAIVDAAVADGIRFPAYVDVIPNPVEIKEDWTNAEADTPTLLFVGRIDFGKGIGMLPHILAQLQQKHPAIKLEIAGGDSYSRGVGSIAGWLRKKTVKFTDNISFLGHLDEEALDQAYRRAWVVVAPSKWDTFPNILLEAMAREKPIVASLAGGIPEILENTCNIAANPNSDDFIEGVNSFLEDKALRLEAGKSGYEKVVTMYSPAFIAERQIQIYREYLAKI